MTPKFKTGDLVEFDSPPLRFPLRLPLHDDKDEGIRNLGVVTECHKPEDAYDDYHCYDVFWHRLGESCTVFEDEIKIPD